MATESLLVKTKDNYVIVLSISYSDESEKRRLVKQCEQYCQSVDYYDFNSGYLADANIDYDGVNTDFLHDEITGYHYKKHPEKFVNEIQNNNYPARVNKPNVLHFDYRIPDKKFPALMKNISYHVKPDDKIYKVVYNKKENSYEAKGFKIKTAEVNYSKKELTIIRNHFEFEAKDYEKLQKLLADYNNQRKNNPRLLLSDYENSITDYRDAALFHFYRINYNDVIHLLSLLEHEIKHVKNKVFMDGLSLREDYKRLSVDNMYRISVENERSAYLQQLVFCINEYLKKGNYDDFSMFDGESRGCAKHLKNLATKEERIAYATNWPVLVDKMMDQFKRVHQAYYDENQFENNVLNMVETAPLTVSEEVNGETFKKLRSLYYNFLVYNPATGRDEYVNLSKYILRNKEVSISDEIRAKIITPAEKELKKRQTKFSKYKTNAEINVGLVSPAKKLMRGTLKSQTVINEIDGMSVGRLFDDEKTPEISLSESNNNPTQKKNEYEVSWNDDLEKYWSKVGRYRKIVKNEKEYIFKIKNAKISYRDKNHVNVTSNADFELYVKLLKEPNIKNNTIEFASTLSKEQALMLYVACVNYGRKMSGCVPKDLSGINKLKGVPSAELNKFNHRTGNNSTQQSAQIIMFPSQMKAANAGR